MINYFKSRPAFVLLFPVFFVLHGCIQNYNSVPVKDAVALGLLYWLSALLIAGIGWLIFRDILKACILSFSVMAFQFFFGNMQDALVNHFPRSVFSQYRFILPASLFFFLLIIYWLKKTRKPLLRFNLYLNILMALFILADITWSVAKPITREENITSHINIESRRIADTCSKPDIYLILLDQYAGNTALKEAFNFDNSSFIDKLSQRGFQIAKESRSNYNLTPFSVASILNMNYLSKEMGVKKNLNIGYSYRVIKDNDVLEFLTANGYTFYNYSIFDFPDNPGHEYGSFLPYGINLVTSKTFTTRLTRDLKSGILEGKFGSLAMRKKIAYSQLHFNENIFTLTGNIAGSGGTIPKFVYSHFMLPHFPYYYDSKGNPVPLEKLAAFKETDSKDYIEYLQYGNQKIIQLVDEILNSSSRTPVIILLSDHGFRNPDKREERKYDFLNLNALYLPGKNYGAIYDSISNVNQFRVIFNSCFNLGLPLLKDSTIDLWD